MRLVLSHMRSVLIVYMHKICLYRGTYIRAHVLFNLLYELSKSDKMRGLPNILSLFRDEFYKFNKTGIRTLNSIYHKTLRLL